MKRKNKEIIAFGYVKQQDGIYTAICVNMGLFGQGKTPEQALRKVHSAIDSYVAYILERHPNKYEKFLYRPAPADYIEEFKEGIKELKKLTESRRPQLRQSYPSIPIRSFAETVSYAQAQ